PVIRVELSDHLFEAEPGATLPFEFRQLVITYYLSNTDTEPVLAEHEYRVPLPFVRDWNEYTLNITEDVRAAFESVHGSEPFPYLDAGDNSAHRIFFGLEGRAGARAEAYFDALRIEDEVRGDALLDRQRAIAADFESRVPEVHQLHGTELSLSAPQHLNEFGEIVLADYDELAQASPWWDEQAGIVTDQAAFKEWLFAEQVRRAHARGNVVSYNHMWGGGLFVLSNQEMVDRLVANQAYGCDILEVGYRSRHAHDLPDYLWVWDELQKREMYLLGNGTSDLHGPTPGQWLTHGQNMITWIYAASLDEADLLDGLRRGRLYFGDPRLFPEGMMDVVSGQGHRMGQIVLTDRAAAEVTLELQGADAGDEVRVVVDGVVTETHAASEFTPTLEMAPVVVAGPRGSFVRFEVYRSNGQDKGFSNHLHFVRRLPAAGVPHWRAAFDVGGVVSLDMDGLTLLDVVRDPSCGAARLEISLHTRGPDGVTGSDGWMTLDVSGPGVPDGIAFGAGVSGMAVEGAGVLTLAELSGDGTIVLTWGCEGDITGDGAVNFDDLNLVLDQWGASGVMCDPSGDGVMGFDDLNLVLATFGATCGGGGAAR
ncbi:MAG: hypothetical protein KDA21_04180, partial [Phycisphaerales bacterium]|nr:hypothetical protein [Phycisphaerales bacterium]